MDYRQFNAVLEELNKATSELEEAYIENGGEVTEETEAKEAQIEQIKALLEGEGIDMLGGWLKAKEDKAKALKAEKAYVDAKIKANNESIEFVKGLVTVALGALGVDKVKGSLGYSFARYDAVNTEVDTAALNELYGQEVEEALKGILPPCVTVKLGASVKKLEELDYQFIPPYFIRTEAPAVKFVKPRTPKED